MPQFDQATFLSQIFWCFFGFLSLYLIFLRGLLPGLATSLKIRNKWFNQVSASSADSASAVSAGSPFSISIDFLSAILSMTNIKVQSLVLENFQEFESKTSILKKIESAKVASTREVDARQSFRKKSIFLAGMKSFQFV
jgi:hypothetical protein